MQALARLAAPNERMQGSCSGVRALPGYLSPCLSVKSQKQLRPTPLPSPPSAQCLFGLGMQIPQI